MARRRSAAPELVQVVYSGPDAAGVRTPDGGYEFPYGEAVYVPASLAESLLQQATFTTVKDRTDGEGSEAE